MAKANVAPKQQDHYVTMERNDADNIQQDAQVIAQAA
jgi:hypothetical protein